MMIDAQTVPTGGTIETDVCIVGAGPAGITLARELMGQDFRVCLLESGGFELPTAAEESLAEVESDGQFVQVKPENRNRRFGGNSTYWGIKINPQQMGVRLVPLDEADFEKRDWLPYSGWPFSREHLMPYYERAQKVMGAGPFAYQPEDWETPETPQLPFTGNRATTSIFQFGLSALFANDYRREIDRAPNITTYYHANAMELETNAEGNTVTRVRVGCLSGNQFWVSAKLVLLAAGGVENTHLLLLSKQGDKLGLGNQHDLVGRFFMDHPILLGGLIVPFDRQIFNRTALYDMRNVNGTYVMGGLTVTDEAMRREPILNLTCWIFPRATWFRPPVAMEALKRLVSSQRLANGFNGFATDLGTAATGLGDIAGAVYRKMTNKRQPFWSNLSTGGWSDQQSHKEQEYGVFEVVHMIEQAPDPDNRLQLGEGTDPLGRRRIRLDSRWRETDLVGLERAQRVLAEELERSGIGRFQIEKNGDEYIVDSLGASHHIGTTRMHDDPRQGVVDAEGRVHSVSNLFIASSSVFPTGSSANPTLTIVALAVRLADRVKAIMAGAPATPLHL